MSLGVFEEPTHRDAIRAAWLEFKEGVSFRAFCLHDPDPFEDGGGLPWPIAWLCAPWGPLAYRFKPFNLERIFRPQKAERRQRLSELCDCVFWCGGAYLSEETWAEADALVAEFGDAFPPRDWEPMSAAEAVGAGMGMTREEVAEIVGDRPRTAGRRG
jgi:hypothetical protein